MEQIDIDTIIDVPPEDVMGPAMLALEPRQRRFVCAMIVLGDAKKAYAWAGYQNSNSNSLQAAASRLGNMDSIKRAAAEEGDRRVSFGRAMSITGLMHMASPGSAVDAKIRLKALAELADRTGFTSKTEVNVTVKDDRSTNQIIETIKMLAIANGQDPRALLGPAIIDAEFEEVPAGLEGLEDLI